MVKENHLDSAHSAATPAEHPTHLRLKLRVWRQRPNTPGAFEEHDLARVPTSASFLEMMDLLNEGLIRGGKEPVAFDHDCREGICGMCSMTINGMPHGPLPGVTTCQLHMRHFRDGETITIEPWRARAFPVVRDLVVNRSAFDKVIQAGGFISVRTGSAPEANNIPVPKPLADAAMDAAECIGCGACVAACKNGSAMLFVGAKVTHLNLLPQGKPEAGRRAVAMVKAMDEAGFGNCTNYGECQAHCPKGITLDVIAHLNRDYLAERVRAFFASTGKPRRGGD
jgi:succinate dehydrogenase / fumarate reductase iron-sulfur subunit